MGLGFRARFFLFFLGVFSSLSHPKGQRSSWKQMPSMIGVFPMVQDICTCMLSTNSYSVSPAMSNSELQGGTK